MSEEITGRPVGGERSGELGPTNEFCQENAVSHTDEPETAHIRAARARLIEETTYRLTDLFTIVSARMEMLGDRMPAPWREELTAIRKFLLHGIELNKRLHLAVADCRRGLARQEQSNRADAADSEA